MEYARTVFSKYAAAQRKGTENETAEPATAGSLHPFSGQVVNDMVTAEMEDVRARRCRQGTRKTSLEKFCNRKVLRGNEMGDYSALEELELMARELLR